MLIRLSFINVAPIAYVAQLPIFKWTKELGNLGSGKEIHPMISFYIYIVTLFMR